MSIIPIHAENPPPADEWQHWMDANLPRLFLFARQQTRNETDAEDVLQEALLESWRRSGGSAPDLPLIYTTIRRRAIDLGRKIKVRRDYQDQQEELPPEHSWITPCFEELDDQRELRKVVATLPENLQEVITLKVWTGLTFREIAQVLEIPQNTAASRYRIALEKLRTALNIKAS